MWRGRKNSRGHERSGRTTLENVNEEEEKRTLEDTNEEEETTDLFGQTWVFLWLCFLCRRTSANAAVCWHHLLLHRAETHGADKSTLTLQCNKLWNTAINSWTTPTGSTQFHPDPATQQALEYSHQQLNNAHWQYRIPPSISLMSSADTNTVPPWWFSWRLCEDDLLDSLAPIAFSADSGVKSHPPLQSFINQRSNK